jgi:hypothetical protein
MLICFSFYLSQRSGLIAVQARCLLLTVFALSAFAFGRAILSIFICSDFRASRENQNTQEVYTLLPQDRHTNGVNLNLAARWLAGPPQCQPQARFCSATGYQVPARIEQAA